MRSYAEALKEFRLSYFPRAVSDAGGNQCAAAKAIGVHRNNIFRVLSGAGYSSALLKLLSQRHANVQLRKGPRSEPATVYVYRRHDG